MPYGIKISKPGKNINSSSLDDFYINSDYPLLKVHSFGSFTTDITGYAEITHNLGYRPYTLVFSQYVDWDGGLFQSVLTNEYYQHDWYQAGATVEFFGTSKIYTDRIEILIGNTNDVTPGNIDGFYYIFKDEVA